MKQKSFSPNKKRVPNNRTLFLWVWGSKNYELKVGKENTLIFSFFQHQTINDVYESGFIFTYFTSIYITEKEKTEYRFCYDYGYRRERKGWYKLVKSFL